MNPMMSVLRTGLVLAVLTGMASALGAAEEPTLPELKKRFKERIERLNELKADGTVGETLEGLIEAIDATETDVKEFIAAENTDRKAVYRILAKQESTSPEKVARLNARRNYEKATKGTYLQQPGGEWVKKEAEAGTLPSWYPAD